MDLSKNKIPAKVKRIHLIAVCGTAMGALASMLKDMGFEITGSDQNVYPPMSIFLKDKGIAIAEGFDKKNITYGPDLVVVGNTVSKDNPEVASMLQKGLHFCSLPQAVNRFLADGKKPLIVTGTHGKTTTSSILAWILHRAGLDPCFLIGGILQILILTTVPGQGSLLSSKEMSTTRPFLTRVPSFCTMILSWQS